jgi:hypothetical protein
LPRLQLAAVAEDTSPVEGETEFRAVPVHELIDGVPVTALGVGAGQTAEYGGLGVLQIGRPKGSSGPFLFAW